MWFLLLQSYKCAHHTDQYMSVMEKSQKSQLGTSLLHWDKGNKETQKHGARYLFNHLTDILNFWRNAAQCQIVVASKLVIRLA